MPDTGDEPGGDRSQGVELVFVFAMPALILVPAIAAMAATGWWWLVGVLFVGTVAAAGTVARALVHLTDEATATTKPQTRQSRHWRPRRPHIHLHRPHRVALHH